MSDLRRNWDSIRWFPFPPMCYYPPIWEIIIASKLDELYEVEPRIKEMITEELKDDPVPIFEKGGKARLEKHLNTRIQLTKTLVTRDLLDQNLGDKVIAHFKNHLEELATEQ